MVPGLDQLGLPVLQLGPEGQVIWKNEDAAQALADDDELVIRNGRLRIRNRDADQRLQAAIDWAAQLHRFLMSRGGAMPIIMDAGTIGINQHVGVDADVPFGGSKPSGIGTELGR